MKLTLLIMLSFLALSSYADKGIDFTNNSKLNSFNTLITALFQIKL